MSDRVPTFRIEFSVRVTDRLALWDYANERIKECWQTTLDDMLRESESKTERALLEALLYSNENPSPVQYGVEFGGDATVKEVT